MTMKSLLPVVRENITSRRLTGMKHVTEHWIVYNDSLARSLDVYALCFTDGENSDNQHVTAERSENGGFVNAIPDSNSGKLFMQKRHIRIILTLHCTSGMMAVQEALKLH